MKFFVVLYFALNTVCLASPPGLQLANIYNGNINIQDYWISEKYDGVRAYWNGQQLLSRAGNVIRAPGWFTSPLPAEPLDGELWLSRGMFDQLSGIVRRQNVVDQDWLEIKYMVFDLPGNGSVFDQRIEILKEMINEINTPFIQLVKQEKILSHDLLIQKLDEVVDKGGEGLMLHLGSSTYKNYRSDNLLKLKKFFDAEAVVIEHLPGKGKYKGMLGSILVETSDKKRFKIGSGFSNAERLVPPAIGAIITYRYFGHTNNGTPRFASFVRIRDSF